ncbi:MAG: hypothetical protein ABIJ43_04635 [Candidatus Beckwithbacteria bacterium]|nr:hypothetical protein [Patescibacteria group bacterium]
MNISELNKAEELIYFTKDQLLTLNPKNSLKSIEQNIYRWLKKGKIISLKRGTYTTRKNLEKYSQEPEFREFLASRLKIPSYLSLEYILSKHEVLTEGTFPITLVTLKTGSRLSNNLSTFIYKNIKKDLFLGYKLRFFGKHEYYVATKAKALFDYFYFKAGSLANNFNKRNLVKELRLNLDSFSKKDFKELEKYSNLAKINKLKLIIKNIIKYAPNNL